MKLKEQLLRLLISILTGTFEILDIFINIFIAIFSIIELCNRRIISFIQTKIDNYIDKINNKNTPVQYHSV